MPIKLKWAYEEGGVRHEAGETLTLSAAEEKWLVDGRYAVRVGEAEEPKVDPEDLKKKGSSRKGAADGES